MVVKILYRWCVLFRETNGCPTPTQWSLQPRFSDPAGLVAGQKKRFRIIFAVEVIQAGGSTASCRHPVVQTLRMFVSDLWKNSRQTIVKYNFFFIKV